MCVCEIMYHHRTGLNSVKKKNKFCQTNYSNKLRTKVSHIKIQK